MFGKNQFGDPHFKIVWGQSQFIRMGNIWRDRHGNERIGYRERPQCHNQACWVIMKWKSPKEYGSPATFYSQTFDSTSKLYITGEYPWRGRYEIVQPLISKEFVGGKLVVTHFPLSHMLIDKLIPLMVSFANMSQRELAAIKLANKVLEDKKETEAVADALQANMPTWMGPVSYTRQGIKTSVLQRKMDQIQKVWDRMSRGGRKPRFARGMAQGTRPVPIH